MLSPILQSTIKPCNTIQFYGDIPRCTTFSFTTIPPIPDGVMTIKTPWAPTQQWLPLKYPRVQVDVVIDLGEILDSDYGFGHELGL